MKLQKPMRWKEGMFLKPQHFQQYDLYVESREIGRFHAVESFGWGLLHLQLDESALDNYVFSISALRAVLPNGTLVDYPETANIASREFGELMKEVGQGLDVSVGVKAQDDRGPWTAGAASGAGDTRYLPAEEEVYDLDAGRDPAPLEKLAYNLRIFMGNEPTDGYETLPLARLVLTGDTVRPVRPDPKFSPPALVLAASQVLHGAARAVVEALTGTLRDLGQRRGVEHPDPLILYYGLSGSLPVLKDMVQEGQVHTRKVFHELARLAGALFFRDPQGRSAEEVPAYDHRHPGPVFERLRELIIQLSEIARREPFMRCPMERDKDQFHVMLPDKAKQPGTRLYLEVLADDSTPKLRMLMLASKISTPGRIQHLRDNALPGVPTEAQPEPPAQLGPGQRGSFFRLQMDHTEWGTHVSGAGELTLFMLGAPADVKISLVLLFADSPEAS